MNNYQLEWLAFLNGVDRQLLTDIRVISRKIKKDESIDKESTDWNYKEQDNLVIMRCKVQEFINLLISTYPDETDITDIDNIIADKR